MRPKKHKKDWQGRAVVKGTPRCTSRRDLHQPDPSYDQQAKRSSPAAPRGRRYRAISIPHPASALADLVKRAKGTPLDRGSTGAARSRSYLHRRQRFAVNACAKAGAPWCCRTRSPARGFKGHRRRWDFRFFSRWLIGAWCHRRSDGDWDRARHPFYAHVVHWVRVVRLRHTTRMSES